MLILALATEVKIGRLLTWLRSTYGGVQVSYGRDCVTSTSDSKVQVILFIEDQIDYNSLEALQLLSCRGYTHILFERDSNAEWEDKCEQGHLEAFSDDFILWATHDWHEDAAFAATVDEATPNSDLQSTTPPSPTTHPTQLSPRSNRSTPKSPQTPVGRIALSACRTSS